MVEMVAAYQQLHSMSRAWEVAVQNVALEKTAAGGEQAGAFHDLRGEQTSNGGMMRRNTCNH